MLNEYFKIIAVVLAVVFAGLYGYSKLVEINKSTRAFEEAMKIKTTVESLEEGYSVIEIYLPEDCSLTITKSGIEVITPVKTKSMAVNMPLQSRLVLSQGTHRLKITSSKVEIKK